MPESDGLNDFIFVSKIFEDDIGTIEDDIGTIECCSLYCTAALSISIYITSYKYYDLKN